MYAKAKKLQRDYFLHKNFVSLELISFSYKYINIYSEFFKFVNVWPKGSEMWPFHGREVENFNKLRFFEILAS